MVFLYLLIILFFILIMNITYTVEPFMKKEMNSNM